MFSSGFEKLALSLKKYQKMVSRGIASRTGIKATQVHRELVRKGALGSGKSIRNYNLMMHDKGMDTHSLNKFTKGAIKDHIAMINLSVPKAKAK